MRMIAAAVGIASLLFIGCAGGDEPATDQMEEPAAEMMDEAAETMEEVVDTMQQMAPDSAAMEEAMPEAEGEGGEEEGGH